MTATASTLVDGRPATEPESWQRFLAAVKRRLLAEGKDKKFTGPVIAFVNFHQGGPTDLDVFWPERDKGTR